MFCSKCGKEVKAEWKICPACGAELSEKAETGKKSTKQNKKEALVLQSAEPITDGGRKWNIIYVVMVIVMEIIFIVMGSNFLGIIFAFFFALCFGWIIKNKIAQGLAPMLREYTFYIENQIPYPELINRLIPVLMPLGFTIEKASDVDGTPVILYKGIIYDVNYGENYVFNIWWRRNIARAFLTVDTISLYRNASIAMGIIAYYIQQVCDYYEDKGK